MAAMFLAGMAIGVFLGMFVLALVAAADHDSSKLDAEWPSPARKSAEDAARMAMAGELE